MNGVLSKLKIKVPSLFIQGFADDLVKAQECTHPEIMCERLQQGLRVAARWCSRCGLKLDPSKTEGVVLTRKRRLHVPRIRLDGKQLRMVDKARYLGAIIDSKFCWSDHVALKAAKATTQFALCRRIVGNNLCYALIYAEGVNSGHSGPSMVSINPLNPYHKLIYQS